MKSKKLVKYILVVSVLILITISISYFVITKSNKKNNIQSENNLKLAASNDFGSFTKRNVSDGVNYHTIKFSVKKPIVSSIEKGCDYYGNIYMDDNLLKNYTWRISNYYCRDSFVSNISIKAISLKYVQDFGSKSKIYMLSITPDSDYNSTVYGLLTPTHVIFDSNYNFLYQIPYPSSLKIKIGNSTYNASNGVDRKDSYSYWYYEPSKEKPNIINKRIVKFNNGVVDDSISEELSGTVVSS